MQFGKLEKVDLRKGWNHEAYDFTQWLALPENMQLLSDEIGLRFKFQVQQTDAERILHGECDSQVFCEVDGLADA